MQKIKIGIVGYGNLGKGVEYSVAQNPDMEVTAVFTRRSPESLKTINAPVYSVDDINKFAGKIDVMILCGGSASDLPKQSLEYAAEFNIVDSFDTHAKIPEHFASVDKIAHAAGTTAVISSGWDPGLFSINRAMFDAILPVGSGSTFWGKGVSQGHSDAIRRINGVADGKQYTIPVERAMESIRNGEDVQLTARDKHLRECFVVAEDGADKAAIEKEIKEMPNYFADYNTVVHFISAEDLARDHAGIPHGGFVIHNGKTGANDSSRHTMEFSIKLDSNPEFTASVLTAYARAVYKMSSEGICGAKTVFDIPIGYLSAKSPEQLRAELL